MGASRFTRRVAPLSAVTNGERVLSIARGGLNLIFGRSGVGSEF